MSKAVTTLALAMVACVAGYHQPQAPPSSTRRRALAGLLGGPATAATAWVAGAQAEEQFQLDPGARQVCLRRGLLGACSELAPREGGGGGGGGGDGDEVAAVASKAQVEAIRKINAEEDANPLIEKLRKQSEANRAKNEAQTAIKTFENGQSGEFGPFSRYIPIRQLNGVQYELLTYPEYERLKKQGKIKNKAFTVERPSVAGVKEAAAGKTVEAAAEKTVEAVAVAEPDSAPEVAPAPAPVPKPDPWKEAYDEASGRNFWYNRESGESSWARP